MTGCPRNANRIHHIVLPIQSGSERIIQKMKRGYTGQRVAESLHSLKSAAPDIELSTHVIVGFRGETEDDFQDTVAAAFFKAGLATPRLCFLADGVHSDL